MLGMVQKKLYRTTLNIRMEISQFILYFQVVVAAVSTPVGEMEISPGGVEKGVKDSFKEEWVDTGLCHLIILVVLVVLVGVVVRVGVEGVVEGIPGGAVVETKMVIHVEEGEVLIMLEKISRIIVVIIQLAMVW